MLDTLKYFFDCIKSCYFSCQRYHLHNLEEKSKFDYQKLGDLYMKDLSIEPDYKYALNLYLEAVNLGLEDAQTFFNIGYINYSGKYGVEINYNQAFEWFKKAAVIGNKESLYYLATLYLHGFGCKKDIKKAIMLLRMCAKSDNCVLAQKDLGVIYEHGFEDEGEIVIKQNFKKAIFWYKIAANNGCIYSMNNLSNLIFDKNIEETELENNNSENDSDSINEFIRLDKKDNYDNYENEEVGDDL